MMHTAVHFSIVLAFIGVTIMVLINNIPPKHPYADFTVEQLIEEYEYGAEVHQVTTDDGYILTIHRISQREKKSPVRRIPVLMVPGFAQTSWNFVNFGPNKSLSFLLAEEGYDVWIGNIRSSTWSRKHKILDPDRDTSFWDYSLHEIGIYDIPAFIDYILNSTGQEKLHYVGYSQGTIVFFIMGSEKREYMDKIKLMTALAPSVYMKNPKSFVVRCLVNFWKIGKAVFSTLNFHELFNKGGILSKYTQYICHEDSIFVNICLHNIFLLFGYNYDEVDTSYLASTSSNTPAGTSTKQFIHILQMIETGEFRQYDHDTIGNLEKYQQEVPPTYNLTNITVPVALYYSSNDWLVNTENVDKLAAELPNVVKRYHVPSRTFNHYDFISSKNAVKLLYNVVISEILNY